MPQQPSRSGEDDGPPDETKTYHTEGEHEEKINENVVGVRESFDHLNDVKSSLVNEGESSGSVGGPSSSKTNNSTNSTQRSKRLGPSDYVDSSKDVRAKKLHGVPIGEASALGLNGFTSRFANSQSYSTTGSKAEHFHDIARFAAYNNLAIIAGGYHPNGSMVPGSSGNKISMVHPNGPYPPSLAHLMMYNQDHYPPGTPPPPHLAGTIEVDAKTGIPRPRHSSELPLYHPLSPGSLGSVPHHLEVYNVPWQGQPFYPLTGALRSPYPTLINASGMSRIGHPGLPPPHHGMAVTGIPHPAIVTSGSRQQDTQQQSNDRQPPPKEKESKASEKRRAPHIKKPLNAFMLYMKEKRASVVKECTLKESAAINQILGRRWHALSREEQAKYYELARKERQLHMQLYPSWTARDNYAIHGKKKKKKKDKNPSDNSEPSTPKKCRARFGVDQQEFWCKPCRRKKKCIRYICSDENGQNKDDSCESDDEQDFSPPPSQRMPSNGIGGAKEGQDDTRPPTSEPLTQGSTSHHQHPSQSMQSNGSHNHPRERAPSTSSSISEPRPPPPPPPPPSHTQAFTNASSAISTQPPTMHLSQSPMVTQTSPAIVHLPHPSISHSGHHMSFTSTSPMMVFPSQPSIFGASQGDMLRGPAFPNGLTPHGLLQLHSQSRPPPTPEMPQDLSMKSATVTA